MPKQKIGVDGLTRSARYHRKMVKLGFKSGVLLHTYVRQLEYNKAYNKLHPQILKKAGAKQRIKIKALIGSTGPKGKFLYPRLRKDGKGRLKGLGK